MNGRLADRVETLAFLAVCRHIQAHYDRTTLVVDEVLYSEWLASSLHLLADLVQGIDETVEARLVESFGLNVKLDEKVFPVRRQMQGDTTATT